MRALPAVSLALLLAACAHTETAQKPSPPPQPEPEQQVAAASNILAAFRQDLAICTSAVRTLKSDPAFIDSFLSEQNRQARPTTAFLRQSSQAGKPEIAYLIDNPQYVELGVSYHGDPWAVAWVENEAIYCSPTFARMEEAEAMGESGPAWQIRKFFLDKALASLAVPSDPMADGKVEFMEFKVMVQQAAQRYAHAERPEFSGWVRQAIAALQTGQNSSGSSGGSSGGPAPSPPHRTDEVVAFLRGFL